MKKSFLRLTAMLLCALVVLPWSCLTASANSAPIAEYAGTDGISVIMVDETNPLIVEHELLTFDIQSFPEDDTSIENSASVTAQYTFYNPSDTPVTATLLFPFGGMPSYADYYREKHAVELLENYVEYVVDDTRQYDVLVDGQPIEKKLRHSYFPFYSAEFVLEENLQRLYNGYVEDDFFSPELPVTRYTYRAKDVEAFWPYAVVTLGFFEDKTNVYFAGREFVNRHGYGVTLKKKNGTIELYAFGEPFTHIPQWTLYESASSDQEVAGSLELESTETLTFLEFALLNRPEGSPVSETDWYNAVVCETRGESDAVLYLTGYQQQYNQWLMRWYEYEITVDAGSRIVNTVTAPSYPDISEEYSPPVYTYRYLLSPAQKWDSFGTLEVVVNTPYYVIESNQGKFEKVDKGYRLSLDGLPDGELEISLCAKKHPKATISPFGYVLITVFVILVAIVVVLLIVFLWNPRKKYNV